MNAAKFEAKLRLATGNVVGISRPEQALLWMSEGEYPVEVVTLPAWVPIFWQPERSFFDEDGEWDDSLIQINQEVMVQMVYGANKWSARHLQLSSLKHLFREVGRVQRVYKRPRPEPGEFDLYLLVWFGFRWIGLRTRIVET
ncbi:hypothetical protein [Spirosoma sordidisoli]|uniref:Uncharacterized protein n=1 Tax=Spirosoma sordidisoli TaxID=2502893 RepID=A0A4Q2UN62_9BACT|nr:hypothetical protein [Spirosoma sordidisoli]RYC70756.1 hypothetical protein EQG79_00965 [Spirosoma sordidisoli]